MMAVEHGQLPDWLVRVEGPEVLGGTRQRSQGTNRPRSLWLKNGHDRVAAGLLPGYLDHPGVAGTHLAGSPSNVHV